MKRPGMIGGIGPESTIDYYRSIIGTYRERTGGTDYPEILVYSIDMTRMLDLIAGDRTEEVINLLSGAARSLAASGADFAFMASNTPHYVFREVASRSPIPLLSIVGATCDAVRKAGLGRAGLLGTRFTMEKDFYTGPFADAGIILVVPDAAKREFIHWKIFSELELGIVTDETRKAFLEIIGGMKRRKNIEGIILGCTELPLLLKQGDDDIPFFNTVEEHVQSIVDFMLL
ncbi:MAG: aspartate racemase [Spirochaetae bacterium HGW-Spirochaetae-1]|jgi:aspartate racemase|nr:MAG: aspartate racemase [Spirochaetae bacterium HGW-Spirochaetae-1]